MTEAAEEDTRDDVTIDMSTNFPNEHFMCPLKHNKGKNLSYFDSIDDGFESEELSGDENMSMSKVQMKASLEQVAIRILRNSADNSLKKQDPIEQEINRVLESFCNSDCLNRTKHFDEVQSDEPKYREVMQEYKEALEIELATFLPIVKLGPGKYLIGTKQKQLQIKETGCIVRTGGGFMYLDKYLKSNARAECIELNNMINKGTGDLGATVISLLHSHRADKKQIGQMRRKFNAEKGRQFGRLMAQVKELDEMRSSLPRQSR